MTSKPQIQLCITCRFPNRIKHCQGWYPAIPLWRAAYQHSIFIFIPPLLLLEVIHYLISICISIWPWGLNIQLVLTALVSSQRGYCLKKVRQRMHRVSCNLTHRLSAKTVSRASCILARQSIPVYFAALHASAALQTAANVVVLVIAGGESRRRRHSSKPKVTHRVRNKPLGIFDSSTSEDPKLSRLPKQQKLNVRHYNRSAEHSLGTTDLTRRLVALYPSPRCMCLSLFPLHSPTQQWFCSHHECCLQWERRTSYIFKTFIHLYSIII